MEWGSSDYSPSWLQITASGAQYLDILLWGEFTINTEYIAANEVVNVLSSYAIDIDESPNLSFNFYSDGTSDR